MTLSFFISHQAYDRNYRAKPNMSTSKLTPTIAAPEAVADQATELEPPWRVIIHNDDVTPFDFVIHVLKTIFKLGADIAEHVTLVAHTTGRARVVTRPKREADSLVAKAHFAARLEGYPLTFTTEPED